MIKFVVHPILYDKLNGDNYNFLIKDEFIPEETMKPEKQIQQEILYYLHLQKAVKFFWRNNTGAVKAQYKGKSRFIRFGQPGISDILGIMNDGKFLAIEVKTEKGVLTEKQADFMDRIIEAKGIAFVARSVKDVIEMFTKIGYVK